jgi:uncharacterized membrane protein
MAKDINTTKVIQDMIEGDFLGVIQGVVDQQLGIFMTASITVSTLGAIAIYTRSLAAPAIATILFLPVFAAPLGGVATQIMAQFVIAVTVSLIYGAITTRR